MPWLDAQQLILNHVHQGLRIDPTSRYRSVVAVPVHNNGGAPGFRVQIGATNHIELQMAMMEAVYNATVANNGEYNNAVFAGLYPNKLQNKGCYVHVVGNMFVTAGIAVRQGRSYIFNPI